MYILYATTEKGEGKIKEIGKYEDILDIEIIVGMFDKDVVLTIEEETKNFTTPEVTAETFETISILMRSGGSRRPQSLADSRFFPPGSIPGEKLHPLDEVEKADVPKAWMEKPPVYKGTSVS